MKKQFINFLRVLAAICITNSHFSNVWPISGMASGGMLGDVLFFAISGYCLFRSDYRLSDFGGWYAKRINRIYITVIIITLLTCFSNGFPATVVEGFKIFIYPTQYHFVASIMVLYIVYYIWMLLLKRWKIQIWVSGIAFSVLIIVVYILKFDKSWYHIDVVEQNFIRLLFFASMLLGAYFKETENGNVKNKYTDVRKAGIMCIISIIVYFAVRIVIPRFEFYRIQLLTWLAILFALYWIFRWAQSLETFLIEMPTKVRHILQSFAGITLQIYLVQYPIIERFATLVFPLNLLIITILIILAAVAVYLVDKGIKKGMRKIFCHS